MTWGIAGECGLRWVLDEQPSPAGTQRLISIKQLCRDLLADAWIDAVVGYTTLTVFIDFSVMPRSEALGLLSPLVGQLKSEAGQESVIATTKLPVVTLPTLYHPAVAADLAELADRKQLTVEEVVDLHSQRTYFAYANGFAPGFSYLGDVDPRIAIERLSTPRRQVPAGSVGIADRQTAVYPQASPGGWHIIGRCLTPLFDPQHTPPTLISVGPWVKFEAIDIDKFQRQGGDLYWR